MLALLVAADVGIVVLVSVIVGATAPRWPVSWLRADVGPLALGPLDRRSVYRRLRVPALARRLPEAGGAFGGRSKRSLPGLSRGDLVGYLVEVRRAEWVHWLSMLSIVPIVFIGPWWLRLAFTLVVMAVNLVFIIVLRHNRVRLLSILDRDSRAP